MWDDQKRERFNALREPERRLSATEQAELTALVKELEEMEDAYLKPATERLRRENALTQKQNAELDRLIERKDALVKRLRQVLADRQDRSQRRCCMSPRIRVMVMYPAPARTTP